MNIETAACCNCKYFATPTGLSCVCMYLKKFPAGVDVPSVPWLDACEEHRFKEDDT